MKSFKHYAGDPINEKRLPIGCRWIRVTDFDAMGIIDLSLAGTMPLASAFSIPQFFPPCERPAVKLDTRDFDPVRGFDIYRVFQGASLSGEKFFGGLTLAGNVEVQAGEANDDDPGPLRFGQISSPFSFATRSGLTAFFMIPKNAKSIRFDFSDALAPMTRIAIAPVYPILSGAPSLTGGLPTPDAGSFSSWEPGGTLDVNNYANPPVAYGSNVAGLFLLRPVNQQSAWADVVFISPNSFTAAVQIVESGPAFDDPLFQSYVRVAPQPAGWAIFVTDGSAGAAANLIRIFGYVNCAF